jgi:putative heme iron utilization protein
MRAFQQSFRSLIIASVSRDGMPDASYAPYILRDGCFLIYVSRLARHTGNLIAHPVCHVMFLDEDRASRNPFARRRLSFACQVARETRESPAWHQAMDQLTSEFGNVVEMLRQLPDFELLRLTPGQGLFVRGFAQAAPVEGHWLTPPAA